jgi:hypothetical protein
MFITFLFIDLREHRPLIKNTLLFNFLIIIKLQLAFDAATGASKFQQWLIECDFFLIGVIPRVQYLCRNHLLGKDRQVELVVDAGSTGTTAIGLGSGALCLG